MHISFSFIANDLMPIEIIYLFIFCIGLIWGSFISALSYRIPNNISLLKSSQCIICNHKLGLFDLIPLLSYIINAGKCRYCKKIISARYFLIEVFTAILLVINFYLFGINYLSITLSFLLLILVTIIIIDIEHKIIPDSLQLALILCGAIFNYFYHRPIPNIALTIIIYGLFAIILRFMFLKICKKDALGFGDIKFFFIVGLFLNLQYFAIFLFFSGLLGVIFGIYWKFIKKEEMFPFAPALAISLYLTIILQEFRYYLI